jgi:hypothetical protein
MRIAALCLLLAACSSTVAPASDAGAAPTDAWMPTLVTCVAYEGGIVGPSCPEGMDALCWDPVQRLPTWRCDDLSGMCAWRSYAGTGVAGVECDAREPACANPSDVAGCLARPAGE